MARDVRDVSLWEGLIFGGGTAGAGTLIVLMAYGIVPIEESSMHVPAWIGAAIGVAFTVTGLYVLWAGVHYREIPPDQRAPPAPALSWIVGVTVLLALTATSHWVAFGPGPRQFEGGITGSETEGRIAFGIGAVILDLIVLGVLVHAGRVAWRVLRGLR